MQKVTFINARGDSIVIGYQHPFFLNKIEGLGDVDAENQSQKAPSQDGSTYIDTVLSERYIPIEVAILEDIQINRQFIAKIFNPKLGEGLLIYENDVVRREIKAVSEHVPKFLDSRPRMTQAALIDLVCPNPYWLTEEQIDQLAVWEGGLEFPLELPTLFANLSSNKSKILTNDGDVETPIFVTFNGPATAPIRINNITTGKMIEVNQNLLAGEKLEINTTFGQKRVTKILANGTQQNAFHYIKIPESTFFGLEAGNNLIEYSTGADYESAGVTISWRNRFIGV
jgi:hypothetical protein